MAGEQKSILFSFSRALGREAHVLTRYPYRIWQQLYNRLQWEGEEIQQILAPEFDKRSTPRKSMWMHTKTPFRESRSLLRALEGHTAYVYHCAFSPDGRCITSASEDQSLRLWEAASGRLLRIFQFEIGPNRLDAVSPDGRWFVYGEEPTRVLQNTVTGQQVRGFGPFTTAFSPDGRFIINSDYHETELYIWNASTGQFAHRIKGKGPCSFSPDGNRVVCAGFDKTTHKLDHSVRVWDALTGQEVCIFKGHGAEVTGCRFSPDGRSILSTSEDHTLKVWNAVTGELLQSMAGQTPCAFSPDGQLILSAGENHTLQVWEARSSRLVHTLAGHSAEIAACGFSPDGQLVVSASRDHTLRLWEAQTGQLAQILQGHDDEATEFAFSPDGRIIVSAGGRTLLVWDVGASDQDNLSPETQPEVTAACAFSLDGDSIASISEDKKYRLHEASTGKTLRTLEGLPVSDRGGCAISPDGRLFVTANNKGLLSLRETASGAIFRRFDSKTSFPGACAFSPDGRTLGSIDGKVVSLWNTSTGKLKKRLTGHPGVVATLAFSPDGRLVVSGSWDKTLRVWNADSGETIHILSGHKEQVNACAFSPDGRFIVSAGDVAGLLERDLQPLRIWYVQSGREIRTLIGHTDNVLACAYTPDGSYIVSMSLDHTVRVWNPSNGAECVNISFPYRLTALALHPSRPQIAVGDSGGSVTWMEIIGVKYGAIFVTAHECGYGIEIHCPSCQNSIELKKEKLDREVACPEPKCGIRLRINPFLAAQKNNWFSRLFK